MMVSLCMVLRRKWCFSLLLPSVLGSIQISPPVREDCMKQHVRKAKLVDGINGAGGREES